MLTGKQKSFLRSQAHDLQPIIQVGKGLVTETLIDTVVKALEARELIKISVLQNCLAEPKEVATAIAEHADAQIVQVIGRVIILYKKSSKPTHRIITNKIPK
jgi:RNA-binding protein